MTVHVSVCKCMEFAVITIHAHMMCSRHLFKIIKHPLEIIFRCVRVAFTKSLLFSLLFYSFEMKCSKPTNNKIQTLHRDWHWELFLNLLIDSDREYYCGEKKSFILLFEFCALYKWHEKMMLPRCRKTAQDSNRKSIYRIYIFIFETKVWKNGWDSTTTAPLYLENNTQR